MISVNKAPILRRAGKEMTKANRSLRIPLADLTRRKTRPILKRRRTLRSVGFTKEFDSASLSMIPVCRNNNNVLLLNQEKAHIRDSRLNNNTTWNFYITKQN